MSDVTGPHPFDELVALLGRIPGIHGKVGRGPLSDAGWWGKFSIDVEHENAWRVVQWLGHLLNYISIEERLPTVFMPVSPPPYLNGGPEFLSWVIECDDARYRPLDLARLLEDRLPRPIEEDHAWRADEEEEGGSA